MCCGLSFADAEAAKKKLRLSDGWVDDSRACLRGAGILTHVRRPGFRVDLAAGQNMVAAVASTARARARAVRSTRLCTRYASVQVPRVADDALSSSSELVLSDRYQRRNRRIRCYSHCLSGTVASVDSRRLVVQRRAVSERERLGLAITAEILAHLARQLSLDVVD